VLIFLKFEFQQRETFLLKLRSWIDIQQMHEKELKELADLRRWRGCSIQTLLGFHRSYPSGSVHGLHSLTDYFQEISPPSSVEDTLKFWGSVLVVIDALDECAIEEYDSLFTYSALSLILTAIAARATLAGTKMLS
jgi:hypothetical protein